MANDNSDNPFAPRNKETIYRPRPGEGRRGAAPSNGEARTSVPPREPPRVPVDLPPASTSLDAFLATGLNPLLQAASTLLILMGRVRFLLECADVPGLRRQALAQVRDFEERARAAGESPETALAARYILCTALDEAVLSTPWGGPSEWSKQTLLVTLHREAWGGETFFQTLQEISKEPARFINLMEVQYVCLAMGFSGKYHVLDHGHAQLAQIQTDLYRLIRSARGVPSPELSVHWRGIQDQRNRLIRYVPWWVVGAFTLVALSAAFIFYYLRLAEASRPVDVALTHIGLQNAAQDMVTQSVVASPSPAAGVAPRLAQLLRDDQRAGVLSVEARGNQTVVTLIAADLFFSGSAAVNPRYTSSLQHVAAALNSVAGRIFIVGHTDDQPLKSLKYRDNFDLSRARAASVVKLLSAAIDHPARLEPSGVGASEPRYKPETLPENRARNRRVEIIQMDNP